MLERFAPSARQTVIRGGALAIEAGSPLLTTDYLLLALTDAAGADAPAPGLTVTPDAVRAEIAAPRRGPGDRELLAALGIDLGEVDRRLHANTSLRRDDPRFWQLRRSRLRPLRVTLAGPATSIPLAGRSRKVVEVALHYARRRRSAATHADLLCGLLADGSNESVRILCRLHVDLHQLYRDLRHVYAYGGSCPG